MHVLAYQLKPKLKKSVNTKFNFKKFFRNLTLRLQVEALLMQLLTILIFVS